ncbi:ABC transporter, permease protein [Gottschalkia acidurici 9a]|uniref:ABC transporter, permease protein n=1 Tax=Gottschalkia acidurici (strain ATCC 7906 / DSM 604 / BCRC 14475 / CIP 104303 / KCTC 5404 / NCIMB 10678 / 9a) TaxID=1128398 RepID=K0AYB8_GOTA9|nr:ABC transporter [Gottschalkia acidurici]AFS77371.1 ABC transporter, permease protein [Gottschalkia acidurici 9a]
MISYLLSTLEQGLIFGIMVLGVYITYKILDFPDLSVDGSFPLGASVTAYCLTQGMNPFLAIILSIMAGVIAGYVTGFLHVRLRITNLLSGIIVMTGLYSINLRIMGKPNTSLFNVKSIFSYDLPSIDFLGYNIVPLIIILVIVAVVKILLDLYLSTKSGFVLRATGDNPQLVTSLGVDIGKAKILGVAISNGLVALSGSILAQRNSFADVGMGTGVIVIGLASIIIGEAMFSRLRAVKITMAVLVGSIVYKYCIALALKLGFDANDLKLITAIIVIILLGINNRGDIFKGLFKKSAKSRGESNA